MYIKKKGKKNISVNLGDPHPLMSKLKILIRGYFNIRYITRINIFRIHFNNISIYMHVLIYNILGEIFPFDYEPKEIQLASK